MGVPCKLQTPDLANARSEASSGDGLPCSLRGRPQLHVARMRSPERESGNR
jgi:hypothetical protein